MSVAKTREPQTARPISLSFEFFPPKSDEQAAALDETVGRLSRFRPTYVSVTYGAGGTSQDRSLGTVRRMHELGLATAAHLTCAASTRDALAHTIGLFREIGIERFVALRGDPPGGLTIPYEPHPLGLSGHVAAGRDAEARGGDRSAPFPLIRRSIRRVPIGTPRSER